MKIAHLTDTHLNFFRPEITPRIVLPAILKHEPDAVLITGDISDANRIFLDLEELEKLPVPLFFVAGNHDFYGGSMDEVRRRLDARPGYLTARTFVELTERTALVGHDGWYDGEHGDWSRTVTLNDWYHIVEFMGLPRDKVRTRCRVLSEAAARRVNDRAEAAAVAGYETVVIATHVPPFAECSRGPGGTPADEQWLPVMTSAAMGRALLWLAQRYPSTKFDVRCGHTHTAWTHAPLHNLTVTVGGACHRYRDPIASLTTFEVP